MHVLCLLLDFLFYSHRLKIHRLPFLSQTSCLHLVHWFGIQHFEMFSACDSVKCLLHWSQLKRLQSLAPECLLLLPCYEGILLFRLKHLLIFFFFFFNLSIKSLKPFKPNKNKKKIQEFVFLFTFLIFFFVSLINQNATAFPVNYLSKKNNGNLRLV